MGRLRVRLGSPLLLLTLLAGTIDKGQSQPGSLNTLDAASGEARGLREEERDHGKSAGVGEHTTVAQLGGSIWVDNIDYFGEWLPRRGRESRGPGRGESEHLVRGYAMGEDWGEEGGEGRLGTLSRRELEGPEEEGGWEVAQQRDYLNGLVELSTDRTKEQDCNIAFAKTHKTASTTLAMILVRYARRHYKKLASFSGNHVSAIPLEEAVSQVEASGERVDIMHYHYTSSGAFKGRWGHLKEMYSKIMVADERVNFITVLRESRSHFLSYYYYFIQPEVKLSVEHFYEGNRFPNVHKRLENPMCAEFGIRTEEELVYFIDQELPDFRLVLLTERFDEGLMVMRRILGWEMVDMTYKRMMETKAGARRWDGKDLKNVPKFEDLSEQTRNAINKNTELDQRLYQAASELYEERKASIAREIEKDLEAFEVLQDVLVTYLEKNESSLARIWYGSGVQPYKGGPPFYEF